MAESVPNRSCPKCVAAGHDSDSNHLFKMRTGNRWTCRKVEYHLDGEVYYEEDKDSTGSTGVSRDSGDSDDGNRELLRMFGPTVADDTTLPVSVAPSGRVVAVPSTYRGIRPDVFSRYETECTLDSSGEITSFQHELKDLRGNRVCDKVRKLPKDFFTTSKTKGTALQLFGQHQMSKAKRLLITEGEFDAMSAYQMLEKYKVAVWSLPLGANKKCLLDNLAVISVFTKNNKSLYFSMDSDDAGATVEKEIAALFPAAKFLKLNRKDANSYLTDTPAPEEFVSAFWEAEIYKPPGIVRVSSLIKDVLKRPVMGRAWPWPTMTKATYGRRGGEGMYVGAGVKQGKSEFINQIIAHDVKMGWPICAIKYEERPSDTVKRVAGKLDGIFYHKPDMLYKDEDLERTALSLEANLFLHNAFGSARWDDAKSVIRYAVGMGCKTVIIDPVTKLTNGMTPGETETELRRFSDELACMAQDMDFFYLVTCHLKAPLSGPPHERGGKVESNQFRGSRAMMENCFYQVGIQRNKDPDLAEDERNTSLFVGLEDRAFGNTFKFPVFYNNIDQSYLEPAMSTHF